MFTDAEMKAAWFHWDPTSRPGRNARSPRWGMGGGGSTTSARAITAGTTRAQLNRITSRAPQVVVKITGAKRGAIHLYSHMTYLSRNSKLEFIDQDGQVYQSNRELKALAEEWMFQNEGGSLHPRRDNAVDARALIFSMPEGTPADAVRNSAAAVAREHFGENFDYVMVLHTDTPRPHVHLTVRATGHNGEKLTFAPTDLHKLRMSFAHELRERGVAADATPKIARGPVEKRENDRTHWKRKTWERKGISAPLGKDVRRVRRDRPSYIDRRVTNAYQDLANALMRSSDPEDHKLAADVRSLIQTDFLDPISRDPDVRAARRQAEDEREKEMWAESSRRFERQSQERIAREARDREAAEQRLAEEWRQYVAENVREHHAEVDAVFAQDGLGAAFYMMTPDERKMHSAEFARAEDTRVLFAAYAREENNMAPGEDVREGLTSIEDMAAITVARMINDGHEFKEVPAYRQSGQTVRRSSYLPDPPKQSPGGDQGPQM